MAEPVGKPEGNADLSEKAALERLRSLSHPEWPQQEGDGAALKASLTHLAEDHERLKYRYARQAEELARLKAQYTELERMWSLRPDTMRAAAGMEVTELVRGKSRLAEAEQALEAARAAARLERERRIAEDKAGAAARLAELEQEFKTHKALLEERTARDLQSAARAAEEERRRLQAQAEADKARAEADLASAYRRRREELEAGFIKERQLLETEAETWRRKGAEAQAALPPARQRAEEAEALLERERGRIGDLAQRLKLAEMARDAALARVALYEQEAGGLEQARADLAIGEKALAAAVAAMAEKERNLEERRQALEKESAAQRRDLDAAKAKMRAEVDELVAKYRKGV